MGSEFETYVGVVVHRAWLDMMAEPHRRLYLYYRKPSAHESGTGALRAFPDDDEPDYPWQLAYTEPFPRDRSERHLYTWVHTTAKRLPILPVERVS